MYTMTVQNTTTHPRKQFGYESIERHRWECFLEFTSSIIKLWLMISVTIACVATTMAYSVQAAKSTLRKLKDNLLHVAMWTNRLCVNNILELIVIIHLLILDPTRRICGLTLSCIKGRYEIVALIDENCNPLSFPCIQRNREPMYTQILHQSK